MAVVGAEALSVENFDKLYFDELHGHAPNVGEGSGQRQLHDTLRAAEPDEYYGRVGGRLVDDGLTGMLDDVRSGVYSPWYKHFDLLRCCVSCENRVAQAATFHFSEERFH